MPGWKRPSHGPASALDHAPTEVRLSFNETLEPAFSQIALTDAADKPVALARAKVDPATPSVLTAPLPALPAGQYHVRWSAMTRDGHKTKGEFTFSVK